MRKPAKPYRVAEIAYNPSWPETPWYIIRTGVVPEQGGCQWGNESISFETLEAACAYLEEAIEQDLEELNRQIAVREGTAE